MRPQIIVMIGLMGSGKTSETPALAQRYDATVLSSDIIREEFPGTDNEFIFKTLYQRGKDLLLSGKSIIIDATNTTIKARRGARLAFKGIEAEWIAYVILTPYNICVQRLKERETEDKIEAMLDAVRKYYLNFQFPFPNEGWEDIILKKPFGNQYQVDDFMEPMAQFDQKTHWHEDLLGIHAAKVADALIDVPGVLFNAGIVHDIGKLETQKIDANGQAHYYGHANAGAYHLALTEDIQYETILLVNYHMLPFSWETEKTHNKYKNLFGEKFYSELLLLHEADKGSHIK